MMPSEKYAIYCNICDVLKKIEVEIHFDLFDQAKEEKETVHEVDDSITYHLDHYWR